MIDNRIGPGDRVSILDQRKVQVAAGVVLTAHNYGTISEPDWYIELTDDRRGYLYWKQSIDGGTVEIQCSQVSRIIYDYTEEEFGDHRMLDLEPDDHRTVADLLEGAREGATTRQRKQAVERTIEGLQHWLDLWKEERQTPAFTDDDRRYVDVQIVTLNGKIEILKEWINDHKTESTEVPR